MTIWAAIILGILEGLTEFLPVSSTGHLTIAEKLLGYSISDPGVTAFTAIIQTGAIVATLVFFRKDIARVFTAWANGLFNAKKRKVADYHFGWAIILGSIPIGIVGFLFKDQIETTLRSLWVVGFALILWSGVMWVADKRAKQNRHEKNVTWKDTLFIGLFQCLALVPGVSRSGATMSAGLMKGLDRVAVTRLSFFLAIPALIAASALETVSRFGDVSTGVGWGPTIIATLVSFVVAYFTIEWLLKFIANHTYLAFIVYRVSIGALLLILLIADVISAK